MAGYLTPYGLKGGDQTPELWPAVGRLVERAPSFDGLRAHRLHLLAVRHYLSIGRPVASELQFEELHAVAREAATRRALAAATEAYDGRLLIFKGPEVAARYPDPALRPSTDIDLLAEEPESAQSALIAAGFQPLGPFPDEYYRGLHHLRPLGMPGSVAPYIEIHRRLNWVRWSEPPPTSELFQSANPSSCEPKMLTLSPEFHVLGLIAHVWGEIPLRRVIDLIDLLAMSPGCDYDETSRLAQRFKLRRAWETSLSVAHGLLLDGPEPLPLRTWARDLRVPRDRTVLDAHLQRWFSPWWAHPPAYASVMFLRALVEDLTPVPGETARNKLFRVREAITHPNRPNREHREILGPDGVRPRHKRR